MKRILKILILLIITYLINIKYVSAFTLTEEDLSKYFTEEYEKYRLNDEIVFTKYVNNQKFVVSYKDYLETNMVELKENYDAFCVEKESGTEYKSFKMLDQKKDNDYSHKSCSFTLKNSDNNNYYTIYQIESSLLVGNSNLAQKAELDSIIDKILSENYFPETFEIDDSDDEGKEIKEETTEKKEEKEPSNNKANKPMNNILLGLILVAAIFLGVSLFIIIKK